MLREATGYPTPGRVRGRLFALAGLVMVVLLLVWFLSQHLTFTSGSAGPAKPAMPSLPPMGSAYPRTTAGAVDAATFYLTNIDGPLLLQPDKLAAFDKAVGSSGYAEQLVKDSNDGGATLESTFGLREAQKRGLAVALQPQPLAYKVVSEWNGWSVSVAMWWIELVAIDGVTSTNALWQTTTLSLVWENGVWRISNSQTEAGPGPNADGTQLPDQLRDFKRYRNVV